MVSPFPKSSSAAGEGRIVAAPLPSGDSGLETLTYQYPLKLISPSSSSSRSAGSGGAAALVFLLTYGGGLVGGDAVRLTIDVRPRARLGLVTQGHTKVFKSPSPSVVTRQALAVDVAEGAALCLLPDPVQPFAGSVYEQVQVFRLRGPGASLCLLDWVTQGRTARGEDWSLSKWVGRNEVWASPAPGAEGESASKERLLVRDAVILRGDQGHVQIKPLRETMHGLGIFGTLILRGPLMKGLGDFFLAEFAALPRLGARDFRSAEARERDDGQGLSPAEAWRARRLSMEAENKVLWSAANVRGCVVVKFGASTVEAGRLWIGSMITREGSISDNFGGRALMCVR